MQNIVVKPGTEFTGVYSTSALLYKKGTKYPRIVWLKSSKDDVFAQFDSKLNTEDFSLISIVNPLYSESKFKTINELLKDGSMIELQELVW